MERRSPDHGIEQAPLFPDLPIERVGGRQTSPAPPPRGGGYLDVCTAAKRREKSRAAKKSGAEDPRMHELRRIGLSRLWLDIAETIGVDTFLLVWRLLDADPCTHQDYGSTLRIRLHSYATYMRYQRNRFIESLERQGKSPREIQRIILRDLGEKLSDRHIKRLLAGG